MLQYLFSPTKQFTYESGKLLDGGKIYVYIKDTTNLATLYDVDEDYVSNPIILDANGRASVKADDSYEYRLEIYTNRDVLLYTCNAFCDGGTGDGGLSVVRHDETLSGNGTSQSLLGVINIPLAVDETMTAYTATVEEKESLVLGVNGDWFNDTFGSALNDKVDWDSFSACCSAVKGGLDNKLDISAFDLGNYYNKQEINSALELKLDRSEFYNNISGFQTELLFGYSPSNEISSINYSGLYNPWISAAKVLAPTQTLQPGQWFQVLSSVDVSGERNHCVGLKGGSYTFPTVNDFYNWLDLQQYVTFDVYNAGTGALNNAIHVAYSGINNLYNSAYYLLNNKLDISAYSGASGADETPWISGAKILADTQTMTDNLYIQVLSSFTLSGNKNHCIAVKGGTYRFPNAYELGDRIATTNFFMATSSMSSYLPVSSFSSYTASIQNSLNSNWDYTNSAYSLSLNNFYNKLDVSAFSSWSANLDLSGDYIPTSASGSFYPMTGNPSGFLTQHQDLSYISGKIDDKLDTTALENISGEFYPMTGNPSGFLTAHQSLTDYYKKTETSSKEEISAAIAAIPLGDVEVNNVVHNNSAVWNNKLDSTAYHELTAGANIDIQNYVISSKDWTNTITAASSYALNQATAQIPEPFDPTYISGQIDNKLDKSESAKYYPMTGNPSGFLTAHQSLDGYATTAQVNTVSSLLSGAITALSGAIDGSETYLMVAGDGINISSDDVEKTTTISVTGNFDNLDVNNVVQNYSANGTWLTNDDITGLMPKTSAGDFYPMTGNPSGFLTAHQDLSDYATTSQTNDLSGAIDYVSANGGKTYTGIVPIVVNNTTNQISADTWDFSAGVGVTLFDDNTNKITRIDVTGFSELSALSAAIDYVSGNAGHNYTGIAPIIVDNVNETISVTGGTLSAGPNIDLFESGGYVVISATGGGGAGTYTGISPIVVNNNTNEISAKGVSFGVQSPLFFVQDDNEAVVIGCSAGGGIAYTGDAQGALDEVYANSGVWLTAHQDISNLMPKSESANFYPMTGNPSGFLTAHQSLADYQTTAAMTGYVSVSDYNNATARIAALEQVLQTYSGQWLLPNEGEE